MLLEELDEAIRICFRILAAGLATLKDIFDLTLYHLLGVIAS